MIFPTYEIEDRVKSLGYKYIVGTDEAGRGCLAGGVMAAAVYIPEDVIPKLIGKVNDSKKLSSKRREELYDIIIENCNYATQEISAEIIDEINILEATKLAMKGAIEQLEYYDYVLVDGTVNLNKHLWCPCQQIIKGDNLSISIAAASIIAKVTRDRIMEKLDILYPQYGWAKNKAYGTAEHIKAIKTYGVTEFHRKSFRKVGK